MMDTALHSLGSVFGSFIICLISAVCPWVPAELFLLSVGAMVSGKEAAAVILMGTTGQMTGKSILYYGGTGTILIPLKPFQNAVERSRAKVEQSRYNPGLLVFISAFVGIPPFLAISVLAGVLDISFSRFFIAGFAGRLVRFGLCVAFPQVIRQWVA